MSAKDKCRERSSSGWRRCVDRVLPCKSKLDPSRLNEPSLADVDFPGDRPKDSRVNRIYLRLRKSNRALTSAVVADVGTRRARDCISDKTLTMFPFLPFHSSTFVILAFFRYHCRANPQRFLISFYSPSSSPSSTQNWTSLSPSWTRMWKGCNLRFICFNSSCERRELKPPNFKVKISSSSRRGQ